MNKLFLFQRLRRRLYHIIIRQITLLSIIAIVIADWIGKMRHPFDGEKCEIMLTGRFDSKNWILNHLGPLSDSEKCSRLWMVSTDRVPPMPKVIAIYPPKWLINFVGVTQARLLTFFRMAIKKQPHVVGGFYLVANGIAAAIVGRLIGARSMYFCVGGPTEVQEGGIHSTDNITSKMETVDIIVEQRLLKIASKFDTIIMMGTRAVKFFQNKGINTDIHIISGGIDSTRFRPTEGVSSFDLIFTGRLAPIKRIDIFLQTLRYVVEKMPNIRAVIVGDGDSREEVQQMAKNLGIDDNINIVGYQKEIISWLQNSKIFVLTSDSEGLSLSMMEAMMCGLPVIVSNVGDLADLVENGVNGYLVPRRSPELFADRIIELLSNSQKLMAFSKAARWSALRYTNEVATAKWDHIIDHYKTF